MIWFAIGAALVAIGVYLRLAIAPVIFAFDVGRRVGRLLERHRS